MDGQTMETMEMKTMEGAESARTPAKDIRAADAAKIFERIREEIAKVIVGQENLVDRLLMALVTGGHVLLEGMPGLAKTLAVNTLAKTLGLSFKRISFTPDLLPADVTGTLVYNPKTGEFTPKKGPIFANLLLADEINRAPAKVQSALLEAMQERQVTIGDETYRLPDPFVVLATQNPIEQEGTYPLPEAQTDRFAFKCKVDYPIRSEERRILDRFSRRERTPEANIAVAPGEVEALRGALETVYSDEKLGDYILDIVFATRDPQKAGLPQLTERIQAGASPRATLGLSRAAAANALLRGRDYATPQDVKDVAHDVLRHRIMLTYEAEAEGVTSDMVVDDILKTIPVP